jgi:hypothetical protein
MYKKTFYKYKFGYLNIDEENIYLTSTGNWSETKELKEKTFGKSSKKTGKVIAIYFFLTIIVLIILASFLFIEKNFILKLGTMAVSIAGFLRLKRYFDTETGQRFFIPKNKIINVEIDDDRVLIKFKTIDEKNDDLIIPELDGEMKSFIQELKTTNR